VIDREQLRRALEGAAVVYRCAQPAYTRWPQEFPELTYQYERPFVSNARKFEAAFGPFTVTSHEDALRTTLEWYRCRF